MEAKEIVFQTETDTETIVQLNLELKSGKTPVEAARATLARLHGAFALCFLFDGQDDLMVAARRGSPLALGYGDGEMFVGSDALALAPMTGRVCYLDEGDHAILTREGAENLRRRRRARHPRDRRGPARERLCREGPLQHFHGQGDEQPSVIAGALDRYLNGDRTAVDLPSDMDFSDCTRLVLVACGTATYACHVANTGSNRWRASRSRSRSPPNSATASPRWTPEPSASSSASPARPPTRSRRCAT